MDDDTVRRSGGDVHDAVAELVGEDPFVLSVADVAQAAGLTVDQVTQVRLASGLEPVDAHVPSFTLDDVAAFEVLRLANDLFSWEASIEFVRVLGSSTGRITDAANSLFLDAVERPMLQAGADASEVATIAVEARQLADELASVVRMMMRLHLEQSVDRHRRAFAAVDDGSGLAHMAIGFVDLVGFTSRSVEMDAAELSALIARFEATAHDTVTSLRGRLVKLIGDEVMFASVDPADACRIAEALLERFGDDEALTPRGGLAYGPVLSRGGDFFGPIVNLAARLVEQAVPGEVLLTPKAAAASHRPLEPAGRRMLKGFPSPVPVMSLSR
jgi:adenylate cyclase